MKYITETLGAMPKVQIVPECGHNDRCVYTTPEVLPVIFPNARRAFRREDADNPPATSSP